MKLLAASICAAAVTAVTENDIKDFMEDTGCSRFCPFYFEGKAAVEAPGFEFTEEATDFLDNAIANITAGVDPADLEAAGELVSQMLTNNGTTFPTLEDGFEFFDNVARECKCDSEDVHLETPTAIDEDDNESGVTMEDIGRYMENKGCSRYCPFYFEGKAAVDSGANFTGEYKDAFLDNAIKNITEGVAERDLDAVFEMIEMYITKNGTHVPTQQDEFDFFDEVADDCGCVEDFGQEIFNWMEEKGCDRYCPWFAKGVKKANKKKNFGKRALNRLISKAWEDITFDVDEKDKAFIESQWFQALQENPSKREMFDLFIDVADECGCEGFDLYTTSASDDSSYYTSY